MRIIAKIIKPINDYKCLGIEYEEKALKNRRFASHHMRPFRYYLSR